MAFFHRFAPGVLSNQLAGELDLSATQLGTLSSLYFYAYGLLQVPVGVFADRYGVRFITTLGMIILTAGSLLFGLAESLAVIYIARLLMGIGSAAFFVSTLRTISTWFPLDRFTTLLGWTSLMGNMGALLAATPFSLLLMVIDWRSSYYLFTVVGAMVAFMLWQVVRDRPEDIGMEPDFDTTPPPQTLRGIVSGLGRVISSWQFWSYFVISVVMLGSSMSLSGLWLVPYMTHVYEFSRNAASSLVMFMTGGMMLGSALLGTMEKRMKSRVKMMRISILLTMLIWLYIIVPAGGRPPARLLFALLFIMGFIRMFILTSFTNIEKLFPDLKGSAKGVMNISPFLGTIIFNGLIGWRLDATWAGEMINGSRRYTQTGYAQAFGLIMILTVLALVLSFTLTRQKESE